MANRNQGSSAKKNWRHCTRSVAAQIAGISYESLMKSDCPIVEGTTYDMVAVAKWSRDKLASRSQAKHQKVVEEFEKKLQRKADAIARAKANQPTAKEAMDELARQRKEVDLELAMVKLEEAKGNLMAMGEVEAIFAKIEETFSREIEVIGRINSRARKVLEDAICKAAEQFRSGVEETPRRTD